MINQSGHFHETWAHIRDNGKGISQADADALAELRAPMPPSRAHIKRNEKAKNRPQIIVARPKKPKKPDTLRKQYAKDISNIHALLREIGAKPAIIPAKPLPKPPLPPIPPAPATSTACPRPSDPYAAAIAAGRKAARESVIEMRKLGLTPSAATLAMAAFDAE